MSRASKACLALFLAVTWSVGGDVPWGPYLLLVGGLVCLGWAVKEVLAQGCRLRSLGSWIALPWGVWCLLIGISLFNPSHQPEDPDFARDYLTSSITGDFDTLGFANPAVPVEHVQWLPATSDVGRTALYFGVTVGVMAFAVALALIPWPRRAIRIWLTVVFLNGLLLSLLGLYFHFHDPGRLLGFIDGGDLAPYAVFRYKNHWTAFAILSAAVGIGLAFWNHKAGNGFFGQRSPTAFFAFASPFILMSFPITGARAGLLLAALLVAWCLVMMIKEWLSGRKSKFEFWAVPVAVVGLVLAGGGFAWHTFKTDISGMFDKSKLQLEQVKEGESNERIIMIQDTWKMALAKPVFGWGLATFAQIYPRFQDPRLYRKLTWGDGEDFKWVPCFRLFAHCDWLQYAAETGFVGLFLLAATPLAWLIHCYRQGRRNALTHWLYVGVVLILFLAVFEFPFGSEAVALLFAASIALGGKYALLVQEAVRSRSLRRAG